MEKPESHETLEERRKYPRIKINSPVDILYKMHDLQAMIYDISPDGMQIRADSELLEKIIPDKDQLSEENAPLLDVSFHLKLYEIDTKINALCQVYYFNQQSDTQDDNVICGLKFINLDVESSKILDAFITEEMTSF